MENFFAYGTLMCEDIMIEVSGCRLSHLPGTLKGFSRRSVIGEHYPAIVPNKEDIVEGIVYRNVPSSAWDRLDRFEGEMYARQPVHIEVDDGVTLYAETYVIKPMFLDRLNQSDWDLNDFIVHGKTIFRRQYKGFLSL